MEMKKVWGHPTMDVQEFEPQNYCKVCAFEATLRCCIADGYYTDGNGRNADGFYVGNLDGMPHGTVCQDTYVVCKYDGNGNLTFSGQETGKASPVASVDFSWGQTCECYSGGEFTGAFGSVGTYAKWASDDINKTGTYIHEGYIVKYRQTQNVS